IRFEKKAVSNLRLVILRISNSGDIPISPSDFIEPLCFEFGEKTEILETNLLETNPINITASFVQDQTSVTLKPLLLNSEDSIKLKVLLTGTEGEITATARILGVKNVLKLNRI